MKTQGMQKIEELCPLGDWKLYIVPIVINLNMKIEEEITNTNMKLLLQREDVSIYWGLQLKSKAFGCVNEV